METIWKDIDGYKGLYQVSNTGQVRSLDRRVRTVAGRKMKHTGRLLRQDDCSTSGYYRVTLSKHAITRRYLVHRLVAAHFVGELKKGLVINHIDGNKKNNHYTNLQICTLSENMVHACDNNLVKCGEDSYKAKLQAADIPYIRFLRAVPGYSLPTIAKVYDVSPATISSIVRHKSWKRV